MHIDNLTITFQLSICKQFRDGLSIFKTKIFTLNKEFF